MKLAIISLFCLVACADASHLVLGNIADRVILLHHHKASYSAIPFIKRVKEYFYSGPDLKIIQGIQVLDELQGKASVNVTAGGIGFSYVNFRMKSERGTGLQFDIGIYGKQY